MKRLLFGTVVASNDSKKDKDPRGKEEFGKESFAPVQSGYSEYRIFMLGDKVRRKSDYSRLYRLDEVCYDHGGIKQWWCVEIDDVTHQRKDLHGRFLINQLDMIPVYGGTKH